MRSLTLTLLILLSASVAAAQNWVIIGWEHHFRVEWANQAATSGARIDGYVHNTSPTAAENMRMLIDALDNAGTVTSQTIGYVHGIVPTGGRSYFTVAVPPANAYRVRVGSYDWIPSGPMH